MNKIKKICLAALAGLMICVSMSQVCFADEPDAGCPPGIEQKYCIGGRTGDEEESHILGGLNSVAAQLSLLVGAVAVLMLTYNAVLYTYSMGDPGKAGKAKQGIIFALTGVVLATVAPLIFNFAVGVGSNLNAANIGGTVLSVADTLSMIVGSGCLLACAYGGLLMLTSAGNPQKVMMGKKCIIAGFIGAAIAIFAKLIISIVASAAGNF